MSELGIVVSGHTVIHMCSTMEQVEKAVGIEGMVPVEVNAEDMNILCGFVDDGRFVERACFGGRTFVWVDSGIALAAALIALRGAQE